MLVSDWLHRLLKNQLSREYPTDYSVNSLIENARPSWDGDAVYPTRLATRCLKWNQDPLPRRER